ncbi:discoidin domain-containing protein [Butyrivibrio sp. MC2013]|uniref:discoidin domain-containing protein n=1 Tax=Butyrivibrio sp. MC2013 TaxID=1280686 RepID=UPI000419974B|nr:discoidin domain-containing protein [Butyrivibrio sp. MC2013]
MYKAKKRHLTKRLMSGLLAIATTLAMTAGAGIGSREAYAAEDEPYAVSVGRMVYASSSAADSDPSYAVDGSTNTRWESSWDNKSEWICVDLGRVTSIKGVNLYWEGAFAKAYDIQASNDMSNWSEVYSTSSSSGGNEKLSINISARYLRLNMNEKQLPAYGYSLYEFEIMGLDGLTKRPADYGTNIALNKNVTVSSLRDAWWMYNGGVLDQTSVLGKNAVDGQDNTHWTSGESDKQWITVDLGRNYTLGRVILDWESDAGKIYDIQLSTDGNNYTTVYRQTRGYASETANIPLYGTARYLRIYGYTRVESGSGFSLKEIKAYEYKNTDPRPTYDIPELPQSHIENYKKGNLISNDIYLEQAKLPVYIDDSLKAPIASNDWWQSSLIKRFGNPMSTMPFKTRFTAQGLSVITLSEGWLPDMGPTDVNVSVVTENKVDLLVIPENMDSASSYDKVLDYSDYSVTLGLFDDDHEAMKATFVKGSPYIFTEYGSTRTVYISAPALEEIYNGGGNSILTKDQDTITTDHIGLKIVDDDNKNKTKTSENNYCLTVPQGTVFAKTGNYIKITFPEAYGYMSIATMGSKDQIDTFYNHGYAFPVDTSVTYDYDENLAEVKTFYKVTTALKRGGFSNETIQCMLPHQWKHSIDDNGAFTSYSSVRGDMKAITANQFQTSATFAGLLPIFAMPENEGFDKEQLRSYLGLLEDATKNLTPAADAYWEGKNLHPLGMGVLMADQLGDSGLRDVFLQRIKKILVNWFTYDGPGDVSYFIYNENWGTLFYKNSEFGANSAICDHHFTYGYFMFAATVLASYDEEFYNDYKDMIELLIRDYANPSDSDSEYCRFRAYDLYEGHSWAGGYADNDSGNNQESASESLFSWVSMYLWGVLTENDSYRDAGAFGFTTEMEAVKQYWFDYDKDNWINDWPYEVVGQVYGSINFYGTFFGGQPLYVYGIQWLPISEYLTYYGMDQEKCAEIYKGLEADTDMAINKAALAARNEGKSQAEIDKIIREYAHQDRGWQHITWPFLSQTDPDRALDLFKAHDSEVQKTDTANTYLFLNAMKELGLKTTDIIATGDLAATVYKKNGKYTAEVWNPCNSTKTVTFKVNGNYIGKARVAAKSLVSFEVFKDRNFEIDLTDTSELPEPGPVNGIKAYASSAENDGVSADKAVDGNMGTRWSSAFNDDEWIYIDLGSKKYINKVILDWEAAYASAYEIQVSDDAYNWQKVYETNDGKGGSEEISFNSVNCRYVKMQGIRRATGYGYSLWELEVYANASGADNGANNGNDNGGDGDHNGSNNGDTTESVKLQITEATASGEENVDTPVSNAFDGDDKSRWASNFSDDAWILFDLGEVVSVDRMVLNWEDAYGESYDILVSTDGQNYNTVKSLTGMKGGIDSISFSPTDARYIKLQGVKRALPYGYSLWEAEIYGR